MECFGNDETGTAEGRIATGDGRCHNTKDGQDATHDAKPARADFLYNVRSREILNQGLAISGIVLVKECLYTLRVDHLTPAAIVEEIAGHGSPDEGDNTFGDHGAVENGAAHLLRLQATGHERTLSAMETTDGTAGDGDEEAGPERTLLEEGICA